MSVLNKITKFGKDHSSELLLFAGIAGGIATVILACKETTKAGDVLDKHSEAMEEIKKAEEISNEEEYSKQDALQDKIVVYRNTTKGLAKVYWPALLTGVLSIGCILGSHKIMKARYGAACAALSATQGLFNAYRRRVVKEEGKEKDRHYLLGSKIEKNAIEEKVVDPKTGKEKTVKHDKETFDLDLDLMTGHIQVFSEFNRDGSKNPEWDHNRDLVLTMLRARQNTFNQLFRAKGKIFLNEVLDELGMSKTVAGQFLGWTYKEGRYISFGIGDVSDPQIQSFLKGYNDCLVLTFNVDGSYEADDDSFGSDLIEAKPIINELVNA